MKHEHEPSVTLLLYRQGDEHSFWNGDGSVWNDRAASLHPSSWNRPWNGSSGVRKRPDHTGTQPQFSRVWHSSVFHEHFFFFLHFHHPVGVLASSSCGKICGVLVHFYTSCTFYGSFACFLLTFYDQIFFNRNLYPKFASPWASAPCRPQDIG